MADDKLATKPEHGKPTRGSGPKYGSLLQLSEASETGSGEMSYDASDMKRLGKKQEFKVSRLSTVHSCWPPGLMSEQRNFGFLSTLGFISIFMATWEFVLVSVQSSGSFRCMVRELISCSSLSVGLINGGFGGLFWVFIGTTLCYSSIVASLAEMESM